MLSIHASLHEMTKLKTVLLFLFFIVVTDLRAQTTVDQVQALGSNLLRVGDGFTGEGDSRIRKHYLEEIANARIFFKNLSIGLRYEMDDPSEVGRSFQGLRRRWEEVAEGEANGVDNGLRTAAV